jgi:hypothetical protein
MAVSDDLLQAKQVLSSRYLGAALRSGVVGMRASLSVNAALAAGPTVHAVGVGYKIVDDKETATKAVRLFVVQKIAVSLLPPRDLLPKTIDGIPVDVIESPPAFIVKPRAKKAAKPKVRAAAADPACTTKRKERQRPVVAGISTAHYNVTAGTLAYFCRSKRQGDDPNQVHVLSNNHVFADVNKAHIGDALYQPGPADGGESAHHFANLHRFVEIKLGSNGSNRVDAAIGRLLPGIEHRPEVCSIGKVAGTAKAVQNMRVRKHGRTTGYTEGEVTDESYDAVVGMDHNNPSVVASFHNQMRIATVSPYPAFGRGGDSGSLVLAKSTLKAVGLYFAGPDDGSYGVANHFDDVSSELEIELL